MIQILIKLVSQLEQLLKRGTATEGEPPSYPLYVIFDLSLAPADCDVLAVFSIPHIRHHQARSRARFFPHVWKRGMNGGAVVDDLHLVNVCQPVRSKFVEDVLTPRQAPTSFAKLCCCFCTGGVNS